MTVPVAFAASGESAFKKALSEYDACFVSQIEKFKSLCEPADQVSIAIVNGCPKEFRQFESATIRWLGADKGTELAAKLFPVRKDQAIAALMRERLKHPCPSAKIPPE
jgi:hypothetical protein